MLLRNCFKAWVAELGVAACMAMVIPGMVGTAGAVETVQDGNSTITANPTGANGLTSWVVDGTNQLNNESLYYSVGDSAPQPVSGLTNESNTIVANTLTDSYTGVGFTIKIVYDLMGGSAGSGSSVIGEAIVVSNTSDAATNLHFYDYTQLALNAGINPSVVQASGSPTVNTFDQTDTDTGAVGEVDAVAPNHYETATGTVILSSLNNGSTPVTLSDSQIAGLGNPNFAFEWDPTLQATGQANSSDIISINKTITGVTVPLPSGAWMSLATLTVLGLAAAAKRRWKRALV